MKRLLLLVLCALFACQAEARTLYVDAKRPNNSGNGRRPSTAKKTIQAAINIAKKGDTILVLPGTYAPIKTKNKKIAVKSVDGASLTTIGKGNSKAASWCLNLCAWNGSVFRGGKATSVLGFRCKGNPKAVYSSWHPAKRKGSGVAIGGTVRSCRFEDFGSGVDWVPSRNADASSPKKSKPLFFKVSLSDCILRQCFQGTEFNQLMRNCSVQRTELAYCGGRVVSSSLRNCLVHGVFGTSGDVSGFDPRTLRPTARSYGPMFYKSKLYNCTAAHSFGGRFVEFFRNSTAHNTIFYNVPSRIFSKRKKLGNKFSFCYEGGPNPGFVRTFNEYDADSEAEAFANFRLNPDSVCIDAGRMTATLGKSVGGTDLDGKPRVVRTIDIGCYEDQ